MAQCQWSKNNLCQVFRLKGTDTKPSCDGRHAACLASRGLKLEDIRDHQSNPEVIKKEEEQIAISNKQVEQIQTLTTDLADLILTIKPVADREWTAFEKLVAAHKSLTSIDADSLRQLELPLRSSNGYDAR